MKKLLDIRRAYDENYKQMINVIQQMGGDTRIKYHRKYKTPLYRKLKELQRREHQLDQLESRMAQLQGELN